MIDEETYWVCSVKNCNSFCFDKEFADGMGCARHGLKMVRQVRQFENGKMIAEFTEAPTTTNQKEGQ